MSSPFAIQPTTLFRLAAISPVAFQSLTSATAANGASLPDSTSSIVELSALGQVLAAGSTLESSLQAVQTNTTNATPGSVLAEAQDFVAAFNQVEQSIGSVLPFLATLPDNALVAQFSQTLNAAATSVTGAGSQDLSSLQAIGISFLAASPTDPAGTPGRLSIDQSALNAAVAANPQGTATLLAQATQPLLQQVALFEAQAVSANRLPGDLSVLATGIPTNLLQNLPADTVLNNVQLTDLDLAAVGLDTNTIESVGAVLDASLSATLAGPASTTSVTNLTTAAAVNPIAANPAPVATATPATPGVAAAEIPVAGAPTVTATSQNLALATAASNSETPPADPNTTSAATLALRNMLADAALRDVIFDPAYSALIASSHLIDFISPMQLTRASAIPVNIPEAVLPINRARAISSYQEAASGFFHRY